VQIILAQANRDAAVLELLKKLCEVYTFVTQEKKLRQILSMSTILGKIAQQTSECARFIRDYYEIRNFCEYYKLLRSVPSQASTIITGRRLGRDLFSEATATIQKYSDVFDRLMQNFRDQVAHDVAIHIHDITIHIFRTGKGFRRPFDLIYNYIFLEEILDLSGMTYADSAGRDTRKQCLPGTRAKILSDIIEFVNRTGDNVPCVLWLSGPAGKGKSAIAHTIAKWFEDVGGLGSCYTFDRQRQADRRHEKIFSTIARNLADRDPEMRRALADAVQAANALKKTADIIQQWQKLFVEPMQNSSGLTEEPIVIVIDALDESGGVETREDLLRILAGKGENSVPKITELPGNLRFIVTSRPLPDIMDEFHGVQHIQHMSMDDILPESAEHDIRVYVSKALEIPNFQDGELTALAKKADGLFEWARLACAYIKKSHVGLSPIEAYKAVMSPDPAQRHNLLYSMYDLILTDIMPRDVQHLEKSRPTELARFCSVMGQILGTAEPLPLIYLNAMRRHFPTQEDCFKVELVVKSMGSLLSGITNPDSPIRPLHSSFYDFLLDQSSSGEFFIDLPKAQHDLAFASLRVMKHGLRFNICGLKSSYLPNCEDFELQKRVQKCIPPHLSYSSRFWTSHVRTAVFDKELAKEVKLFFDHERLFFWLELLALINALSGAVPALTLITQWLKVSTLLLSARYSAHAQPQDHPELEDISSTVMDLQKFIQVFGGIILHSTPHLYVSALSFSPTNSPLSRQFSARFPNTLRVASGRDINWPAFQTVLKGKEDSITSVSFSPDSTRIVTCSWDNDVWLWDAATGQPVGEPLRGHVNSVNSASFSLDGIYIVTGSSDTTARLWNAVTRQQVGEPLLGHIDSVNSVSFSPDGIYIVTGSSDKTVRLWNAVTRQQVGEPLLGHTDSVTSVLFSPDGIYIVTSSSDTTVRLWSAVTRQQVGEPLLGHTDSVNSVSFSPDKIHIVTGSSDKTVRLWNAVTRQQVGEPLLGHTDSVTSVSFSPDGTRIVTGSRDMIVRLWNAATRLPVGELLQGHQSLVSSVSFSPDGTRIVTGSWDQTVRLWDAVMIQPSQQHAELDYPVFSGEQPTIEATTTMTSNSQNNHFISFSSNPLHALCITPELLEGTSLDDYSSTPLVLNVDSGWVVGPKRRLLFWVPPASRHSIRSAELDLSLMAHGQLWQKCREE
jgi:WD40 repeat protein